MLRQAVQYLAFAALGFGIIATVQAEELKSSETVIYPTWKMMNPEAKQQFLAGYLYGFRDARALGEIGLEYAKQNPSNPTAGLSDLLAYYQLTRNSPDRLVPLLDTYFNEPANQDKSLRLAISDINARP